MEDSPKRRHESNQHLRGSPSTVSEMAMLAATPTAHTGFRKEYPWDPAPAPSLPPPPRQSTARSMGNESSQIILPSIRSTFPELRLPSQPQEPAVRSTETSPITSGHGGPLTSPTYVHSPALTHKRKRENGVDDNDVDRVRQVPRLYHGYETKASQPPPSPPHQRLAESWHRPTRTSPFSRVGGHERSEALPQPPPLPSLPSAVPPHDRSHAAARPPTGDRLPDEYRDYSAATIPAPPPRYPPPPPTAYDYPPYSHHSHLPALSTTTTGTAPTSPSHAVNPYERTPFSARPYAYHYQDHGRYQDIGHMSLGGDGKPRKRRGNLPKETTDKLRSWFMAHLSHPYPTEDEKQDLMRQTGLQMNQISNWFINARRRQLPTMINNARVETDATSGRGSEGNILPTTERHEMHHGGTRSMTLSDGEGAAHGGLYDDDGDSLHGRQSTTIKRGSV